MPFAKAVPTATSSPTFHLACGTAFEKLVGVRRKRVDYILRLAEPQGPGGQPAPAGRGLDRFGRHSRSSGAALGNQRRDPSGGNTSLNKV